jgi:Holliday junction resolvase-like predicted endonuclease
MENLKIVHIALVGGQTMPVYLAIRESKATHYIFIHSSTTFSQAKKLAEDTQAEKGSTVELKEIDPLDYTLIIEELDNVISKYNEYIIEANISSGTKPWSIAFSKLSVKYDNVQLIYVDQNNFIYNYKTLSKKEIPNLEGGIKQILRYNQSEADKYKYVNLDEYTLDDEKSLKTISFIRGKYGSDFKALTDINKDDDGGIEDNPRLDGSGMRSRYASSMEWERNYVNDNGEDVQSVKFDFIDKRGVPKSFILESPHALDLVINNHWFEYEVATILKEWSSCVEVWLNVEMSYKTNQTKNEIDIIVSTGKKLLFVECKTKVKHPNDIDKFRSVVKNYGKLGAKSLFINKYYMGSDAENKCDDFDIIHFSLTDERNVPVPPHKLYELLDSKMQINNTR